ncbi:AMP-dependent synthetase/ligase [Natronobeatus ordinarius]|uniref:AMP-dependent synthetase/ligase n=1 Tax=Natronobeatus ordinarius TaxID=2963433 RepID=UPI0020CC1A80|nr:long-chain fatty acid--CoA ligase [Natronobeatus ordinarius]
MDWKESERAFDNEVIELDTLGRLFEESAERNVDQPAQQYKGGIYDRTLAGTAFDPAPPGEYATLTYGEMRDIVRNLAAGFRDLGVDAGERVAIFADTRMEWAQCDFALLAAGAVVTTVYESSSPAQVAYLLEDPGAIGVVAQGEDHAKRVLEAADSLELRFVVVMDEVSSEYADREDVYTLAEVYERGQETFELEAYESWVDEPDLDDLASLIYTSGTTGDPKGVQLTHRNFRANVNQVYRRYGPRPGKPEGAPSIDGDTQTVSYLPLAHVFERTAGHFLMFASGACVAYAESADTLKEDFGLVGPTTATSVPRVYEKIYDAIREQASESDVKRRIFEWATAVSREYHESTNPGTVLKLKMSLADKLVFGKVKSALGGNVEFLVSGGGTLSADLCTLYHGMGLPIYEGYGLTETSPVVTTNPPEEPKIGTIGVPVEGCEVTVDKSVVPEETTDGTLGEVGELLVRGPNVTEGYWNKPEKTAGAFTEEGWFRTGDIVTIRPDDYLVFHERAKQILVLSTGKNVAPAPIEDAFADSQIVEQCMVIGDGEKFVAALMVPNFEYLTAVVDVDDHERLVDNEEVQALVQAEVDTVNEGFEPHERIKEFQLVPQEFTEENEMLTPTMKKKRRVILEKFAEEVADIYPERSTDEPQAGTVD